jgi:hypothetical protein
MDTLLTPNNWFILAQLLGIITICFEFASYQIKDKTKYFLVNGIGTFFWATMFFAIGMATGLHTQLTLIIVALVGTVRNLIFYFTFKIDSPRSREFGLIALMVVLVVGLGSGIYTVLHMPQQVMWLHALGLVAALGFVIGQYLPGVNAVRITVVIYAIMVILTQTPINILHPVDFFGIEMRWNIMGIAIECAKIASVIVFYLRFSKEEQKPRLALKKI